MAERYRDFLHKRPAPGVCLPAFVVSRYRDGSLLLYSHGSFDIWCVYHAVELDITNDAKSAVNESYPFELDTIKVKKMTGTSTDFIGSIVEYALIEFEFDAPEDVDYLQEVRDFAAKYGQRKVWNTFMELYESIPQQRGVGITKAMADKVIDLAAQYPNEPRMRFVLDCLLCAMIAENNRLKKYGSPYDTHLGKKIKALGVYQAIFELNMSIRDVADYSKNTDGTKGWKWVSDECAKRGITTADML